MNTLQLKALYEVAGFLKYPKKKFADEFNELNNEESEFPTLSKETGIRAYFFKSIAQSILPFFDLQRLKTTNVYSEGLAIYEHEQHRDVLMLIYLKNVLFVAGYISDGLSLLPTDCPHIILTEDRSFGYWFTPAKIFFKHYVEENPPSYRDE